ncbi:hypothetical protein QGM61_10715 [Pseudohongiella sp. SYSU M77423]|uniref:hypothetical protein n=1 Tax=Pseudohongiella sp. SYSU M77423 TaxID=3042312 RepID=UPI0024816144|nr:hypothetical protein [Pseudohongiella sp. SYSU M77423]MDH7944292.1 hypothetical protein [Pseudohongiella sp. SYSU M77423]
MTITAALQSAQLQSVSGEVTNDRRRSDDKRISAMAVLAISLFLGLGQIGNAAAQSDTRAVLEALYNATGGTNWTNSTGWLGEAGTECDWFGVQCDQQDALTGLNLANNNLTGELPAALWSASTLQFLSLHSNNLSGALPDAQTFAALTQLGSLDLGGNDYTGSLPTGVGSASNLRNLFLWGNQFSGSIPAEWANLTLLENLSVGGNNTLSGSIPTFLGSLSNLVQLDLAYNAFTGAVPAELANLGNATSINLRSNQLSGAVPQAILDKLDVINLWANPQLTGLTLGSEAACDNQTALTVGVRANGELTPFTDCYFEEDNIVADFFSLDLSGETGTTLLNVQAYSDHYYPHVGVLDSNSYEGLDIVDTQVQQNGLSFEVALPPGQYVLYIHGGTYQPQNVAATGTYWLEATLTNELQSGCLDFNNTWVTKGVELDGAISGDDCLDEFGDPDRLFDSYAIWLEQGDSVTVTLEAEIATQLLSFSDSAFIAGTPNTAAGVKHGLTVTATDRGWHRFAPYTTNNNPLETGAYTIRFVETPVFGDTQACTQNLPGIALGGSANGSLNSETDCLHFNRLSDRYVLTLSESTLFRMDVTTDGFNPLLGLFKVGNADLLLGNRSSASTSVSLELFLAPGQYWLFVSSAQQVLDTAPQGTYSLNVGAALPLSQMQTTGCAGGNTRLVIDGTTALTGEVAAGDCQDSNSTVGIEAGSPEYDGYQLVLPEGAPEIQMNLEAAFPARLSVWRAGQFVQFWDVAAGQSTQQSLTTAGSYQIYVLGQQGPNSQSGADRGTYSLTLTPQVGDAQACSTLSSISLDSSTDGLLDRNDDCFQNGRLIDRYSLTLTETTLFRVSQINNQFAPFTGIYNADGSRLLGSRLAQTNVYTEYLLPAGQYQVFASSRFTDALIPPAGSYTLQISAALPMSDLQTNSLYGPTRLIPEGSVEAALTNTDSVDPVIQDGVTRYIDGYSFAVPAGETITATLDASFPYRFVKWAGTSFSELTLDETDIQIDAANVSASKVLTGPANYLLYILGNAEAVTGSYTLSFASGVGTTAQYDALLALYNATGGANWTNNAGWLGAAGTECSWHGISCQNGVVTQIDLGGNNLVGTLPSELGSLTSLTGLWLWDNRLEGSVPASLGNLVNLTHLDLSYNLLTGQVPASLANLTNAQSINLRNNLFSGDVPQAVLDTGIVNLWGNIALNLAKGDPAACAVDDQLVVGGSVAGELSPFTDCYVESENVMADFYQLDLSAAQGTTLVRIEGDSQFFWPHMGIIGAEGLGDRDIVERQVGEPPFAFEAALAPGEYTIYFHGGEYTGDKNANVPATGSYSLSVTAINELQVGCREFNNTWVTKGVELGGSISSDDCLDDFNEPHRLFDSYAMWLEQGESVTVALEADIDTQILSFNEAGFITASFGPANIKHGVTVTATSSGWHRFAPYTTNNNPTETGAYTIRFIEPPVFGNAQACSTNIPDLALGGNVSGALNNDTDCFEFGRLRDYYRLNISEPTLLRAEVQTDETTGYMPMLGITRAWDSSMLLGSRVSVNNTVTLEMFLAPGQYWLFASSRFTALDTAIEGNYTLNLSQALPIDQMQTGGCTAGDTRLVLGGPLVIDGQVGEGDCIDSSQFGEQAGFPERDSYQLVVPEGALPVQVDLQASFNARLAVWRNGQPLATPTVDEQGQANYTINGAGSYQINVLGQQGPSSQNGADRGSYQLAITPLIGNEAACSNVPTINLSDSINSTLDRLTDCYRNGRMVDRYLLELEETTLFRVQQSSQGFAPLTGVMAAEDQSRIFGTRLNTAPVNGVFNVYTEYLLPAGQYWVFASSVQADGLMPPVGSYTLNLSLALPISDIQSNPQFGPTRLVPQGTIEGTLSNTDAMDLFAATAEQQRYLDAYSFAVAENERITVTLQAGYPILLSKWQGTNFSNLQYVEAQPAAANTAVSYELEGPANYIMYVIGNADGVTGPYTISFDDGSTTAAATRAVLQAVYDATNGATWTNNTNWLSTEVAPCDWFGVHCNQQGVLIGLELPNNNLTGELPGALWNTTSLQFLTLRENNLSGSFPDAETFAALTQLSGLDLGGNDYSGGLPASLGSAGNLTNLFLWGNQFSGSIPTEWANLIELRYLNLGSNGSLSGSLPAFLGDLVNLQDLDLSYNAFTGEIPAQLANLSNATSINLRSNQLSGAVPPAVLDLGVVNLWANPGLTGLALGSPAACDNQAALTVGQRVTGELTPFTDCYFEEDNIMADFFSLDLSGETGTTLLRVDAYSDYFYPHVGVLDSDSYEGLDIVDTQIQQNGLTFEVALPPGEYVLYMHGGTYQPQNVPATGAYWLQTTRVNELQSDCRDFNNTWVSKGVELSGAIGSDDCLDEFGDPDRLFDSYALWLEEGESVTVTMEAEIASQILSFNQSGFIASSPFTPANTKHGVTVTATSSGWHRFAPYTTNNNPTETGAYTIRFVETPVFGDGQACTQNLPGIALGGSANGSLNSDTDCFNLSRLADRYVLNISEPTLLRAQMQTDGFMPMIGLYRAFNTDVMLGNRVGITDTTTLEMFLAPGQYWLFASSRFTALDTAIEGNYSLNLSQALPIDQMQTGGCTAGDTRLVLGGPLMIEGEVGEGDCIDGSQFGEANGFPERDSYQLVVPEGALPVQVDLQASFNARLAVWRNGQILQANEVSAGGNTSYTINGAGSYQINVLGQLGPDSQSGADRGSYQLAITPLVGNETACSNVPTIYLGDSVNGTLDRLTDCYRNGRMVDRYLLELEETTLFRVQQSSQGFAPLTGVMAAADQSRIFGTRLNTAPVNGVFNVYTEYLLPAGQYWVFASSVQADGLLPPVGSYTLTLSAALPISDIQSNPQFGPTRLVPQGTINGELSNTDAMDLFAATAEQQRYLDAYSFAVAENEQITVTLQAGYPILLSKWQGTNFSNLQYVEAQPAAANTAVSYELEGPANYIMYVIGNADGVTGPYTISFDTELILPYVAPAGTDATITLNEDQVYAFSSNDFGFSDEDENAFISVRISSLPTAGNLTLNGTAITEGQEIDVTNLSQLAFRPAPNASGDSYATFTFQVRDNGLDLITGRDGSIDLDPSPNTIQVNVTPVNDAPLGSGNNVTLNAISAVTFSEADFGFSDPDDSPANTLLAVRIVGLPNAGSLLLAGNPVTSGQVIPATELTDLSYEPPAELVSPFLVAFTYQVQDNGGTANGGVDTDATARSFSIAVVIEPPVTPPPTTGGGGTPAPTPTPEQVADEINNLDNDLQVIESVVVQPGQPVSQEVVSQVGSALERTNTLAQQVTTALPAGTEGVNLALNALNTMSRTLTASATVSAGGGTVSNTAATSSINSVATVLNALSTRTQSITAEQRATVQSLASSTVSNSSNLIRAGSTNDELVSMVAATSAVINAASAAGGTLTTELVAQAEALVTKAVKTGISSIAPGINVEDPVQVGNLLRTNPQALEFAIDASVAVKSRIQTDNTAVQQELASRGLDTAASERLTNVLTAVSNPDGVTVAGSTASEVLLSALVQFLTGGSQALVTEDGRIVMALNTGGIELTVDALTGTLMIKAPGETYSAAVVNTRIVSSSVPEGLSFMRDGRALIVANGVAMELAPIAVDLVGFTSLVEGAGYEMNLRERGAVHVTLGANDTFVGVFAYDNLANTSGSCGASTLTDPAGEPNSAGYAFGVKCSNGVTQKIVPFVHDPVFYRSVTDYGLTLTTDRNTGIITIPNVGVYKPGYFVSKLSSAQQQFLATNKDARGVAFEFRDLNGDGRGDVVFYTAAGAQHLYHVAP